MPSPDRLFGCSVIAGVGFFLAAGWLHYDYDWVVMQTPVLIGGLLCLLSLALILGIDGRGDIKSDHLPAERQHLWRAVLWVGLPVPAVLGLGIAVGMPLYVLACLRAHRQPWRLSLALAAATAVVVVGGFRWLLEVPLPLLPPFLG